MDNITRTLDGKTYTFSVTVERDDDMGAPWEEHDGHGVVSGWECRGHYKGGKHPGELILEKDGRDYRFYDFAASCKIALRYGWDAVPFNDGSETPCQQAAKAARADYENLRAWCDGDWNWWALKVELLDDDGEETGICEHLGGIENVNDEAGLSDEALALADEILAGRGTTWGTVTKTTFAAIN